ncbi:glycosyltransferase [Svornostia abyssi]|uniref:Glycosyltransferase n=1 Tax=Svornostia abyssi TaxID=2898438 RepID=A0ABY5PLU8_9ACTN|nr:glycosyltransferase [Parviterribacteraceae bacterium J379]
MSRRVLHVYKDCHPPVRGGVEHHIDALRRTTPGWRGDVLVGARGRRTSVREVAGATEVRVAEFGRAFGTPVAPGFARWIGRLQPDVVHLHMPHPTGELAALVGAGGTPLTVTYHATVVRQRALAPVYAPLRDAVLRRAAAVIVSSPRLAERTAALRPHDARLHVVPFGVDLDTLRPDAANPAQVAAYRSRFPGPIVLAVGRLVYYKGFETLIDVADRLQASVVIAGAGPREASLRARAAGRPNVHLLGGVDADELVALYAAADVFCLPSTSAAESLGMATLEAQAMGVPAVVTDPRTGTVDAIVPERSGLVVAPRDPDALLAALRDLLGDPARRERFADAAREHMRDRSLAAMGAAHAALYEDMVDP